MLLSKAVSIFNVLQDKTGSPNIIESEIVEHFNMAIGEYLNRAFPDSQGGVVNFEQDANVTANLQPLIFTLGNLNMDANGKVSTAAINAALVAVSSVGSTYFRIGSVGSGLLPIRYVKHNNIWAYRNNTYKTPSTTNNYYSLLGSGLQFYPTNVLLPLSITVIKNPKVLTTGDLATELEFSDYVAYNIISIALKIASIGTRDTELLEDVRLAGLQNNN